VKASVAAIAVVLALVASAAAGGSAPVAHVACPENATNCSESGSIALQPNSQGSQSTDTVPKGSSKVTVNLGPAPGSGALDDLWTGVVANYPQFTHVHNAFVRRVITCFAASGGFTSLTDQSLDLDGESGDVYKLFLRICLELAFTDASAAKPGATPAAAAPACSQGLQSVPFQLQRTAKGWHAVVRGTATRATTKPQLKVTCRHTATGLQLTVQPRRRGKKLRSIVGRHFSIELVNPTSHSMKVATKYTFR
jgi:hypothetical protein